MKKIIILVAFILCLSNVFGYSSFSGDDGTFQMDDGKWNDALAGIVAYTRPLNSLVMMPVSSDLDNDGTDEIILLDNQSLKILRFSGSSFDILAQDSLSCTGELYSNIHVYDSDENGYPEIIFNCESTQVIFMYEFNGTSLNSVLSFDWTSAYDVYKSGETMVKCSDPGKCYIFYIYSNVATTDAGKNNLSAFMFNTTYQPNISLNFVTSFIIPADANQFGCFTHIKDFYVGDIDKDGTKEAILTSYFAGGTNTGLYILKVGLHDTNISLEYLMPVSGEYVGALSSPYTCANNKFGNLFTAPSVYDYTPNSGDELVLGFAEASNEFVMNIYDKDLNLIDQHPEIFRADGKIISNVVRGSFFPDTAELGHEKDYCVMGYDDTTDDIDFLCGSQDTALTPQTREYKLDASTYYDISYSFLKYDILIGSSQQSSKVYENGDMSEISSTYGIMRLDWDVIHTVQLGSNIFTATNIYRNPHTTGGAVMMLDTQNIGLADMIVADTSNIFYYDDGFTNSQGQISEYTINPCLDAVWKLNTSVSVTIKTYDIDGDRVRARAILYYGTSDAEDSGWSDYFNTNTSIYFNFIANITGTNKILKLYVNDEQNPETNESISLIFSVGTNGVSFGECVTTVGELGNTVTDDTDGDGIIDSYNGTVAPSDTNILNDALDPVVVKTGLGYTVFWLLIMAFVAGALYLIPISQGIDAKISSVIVVIVEILLLIVGVKLHYIGAGVIWTLIILGSVGVGLVVKSKFFGEDKG